MIEVDNLSFKYKNSDYILKDISFEFEAGSFYILRGGNGVGKTTLAKLLLGLLTPSNGKIQLPEDYNLSYLPDTNGIYENLTVIQNIAFRLGLFGISVNSCIDLIREWMSKFNIDSYYDKPVSSLSLGTKKKVAVICACIVPFNLLILDEPTNGLDSKSQKICAIFCQAY